MVSITNHALLVRLRVGFAETIDLELVSAFDPIT